MLARAGDAAAFDALVRRRQSAVRGLLRRLSRDAALGDDLAQETFLLAWRTIGRLREPGAFGGWLRQIAISVWLQYARRSRLLVEPLDERVHDDVQAADAASSAAARLDLDAALGELKAVERTCVVLAYAEGMSHADIVRATGLALGTVKSHIARGAAKLRARLAPDRAFDPNRIQSSR